LKDKGINNLAIYTIYMLQSKLNTQVQYKEKRTIDAEDNGHESAVYSLDYFEKPIVIVLGKINYTFVHKNIVFYILYMIFHVTI
jgi:hypothetical protein